MATITAELTVSSDITTDLSINKSMTMTKADSDVGLERTSSLNRVYLEDATQVELLSGALAGSPVADMTLAKAAKVYIKYISTDKSRYITVGFGTASGTNKSASVFCFELGKLYGDEWMMIPWSGTSATGDIVVTANVATALVPAIVEYIVFFE